MSTVPATDSAVVTRRTAPSPPIHETIREPVLLRQLLKDEIYMLGGPFAILCQFAHPGIARGTWLHSRFASRIPERLRNTQRFLNAAVFGTPDEKRAIFSVIHRHHKNVKGDGYDANDPHAHKWTAATLFVAFVVVQRAFYGGFNRQQMGALYKETAVWGTSLQMPPDMWPATLDDFWAYWDHEMETLEVTDMAKTLAHSLLYPANVPLWAKAGAFPVARVLTTYFLPTRLAAAYGLEQTTLNWLQYQAAVNIVKVVWPLVPGFVRGAGHEFCLKDMRESAERIRRTGHWSYKSDI